MKSSNFVFRMWFYFRLGYGTYLTFLLGFATTLVTVYYLAINNSPLLQAMFPRFWIFALIALVAGVPMACILGWFHMKGSTILKSEMDINAEANPYNYKILPGYWQEAFTPLYLELLKGIKKILEKDGMLSDEERRRITELEDKLETLLKGGYVGTPKTKANLFTH